jgi:hypothetical protein
MLISSTTMGLVVEPISVIAVTISVDKSTITVGLILLPVALIFRSVFPQLNTFTLSHPVFGPTAEVDGAIV